LSLALDQVGERWTLHIILALMNGPKRYSELKRHLSGAGANILSERLRELSANDLVGRSTGNAPGSDITYHLTERGRELGPVVVDLVTYGVDLLPPPREGDRDDHVPFDQTWTLAAESVLVDESYEWTIDGVTFELAARGSELVRTQGRAAHPVVTLRTDSATLGAIVRGQIAMADAVERGDAYLKGSRRAVQRMLEVVGLPFAQLGRWPRPVGPTVRGRGG
jgi:DNA-binding HxlR family transcriptional regulator